MPQPKLSLIVPTRGRPEPLGRFLASIARTARFPHRIEIVLVIDDDDPDTRSVVQRQLHTRRILGAPGRTMGELNAAGYAAATGEFIMLLNDDVTARTPHWDETVVRCFRRFPDPYVLVHVNDTLIQHHLCVFPIVSRAYCELAGGICPTEYRRYRIDDHIEDPFNMLAAIGVKRSVYLPDVIFEHANAAIHPEAGRVYMSDPVILAEDAPRFEAMLPDRKALVLRMLERMGEATPERITRVMAFGDSFALRTEGRQIVERTWWNRVRAQYRRNGCGGLLRAATRRMG